VVVTSWCAVPASLVRHPPTLVSRICTGKARLVLIVTCQRREVDVDSSPSDEDASPSGGGVSDLYVSLDRKWKEMQLIEEELINSILAQVGAGAGESGDGADDPVHASLSKETVLVCGFATCTGAFVTSEGTSPGVSTLSVTFFVLDSLVFLCIVRMCLPRLVSHVAFGRAKSSTYAPAGTCARLSVLRIAACVTAVPP